MRTEHIKNNKDREVLLVEDFYPYKMKPSLEYIGKVTSPDDLVKNVHSHTVAEIMILEKGTLSIDFNGKTSTMNKGDFIIYNAGLKHIEYCKNKNDISLFYMGVKFLNPEMVDNKILPANYNIIYHSEDCFCELLNYFKIAFQESRDSQPYHFEIAQNTVRTILLYLYRIVNSQNNTSLLVSKSKPVTDICQFLDKHFCDKITLDFLAEKFYINKYYMSHIFKEQCGLSIVKYISQKRIEKAKDLLKSTTLPICSIFEKCGFSDENYFCRTFKQYTGKTPSSLRAENL